MNMDYDALNKSILKLSQDSLNLVREHSLDMSSLCIINDHIISIKKTLQLLSKSISIKVIGSANIGTCLKQSEIDLLFLDKLNQGKEILLKSFPKIVQISEKIFVIMTPDEKYRFKIFTEANFEVEISNLMKKYCLIDTRINELIIFVKLWARENSLAFVSGFHWSLLVISFLQNTEPSVIPSLQLRDHKEKIINGYDVWFDSEYSYPSLNCCSLGQLIYHFFSYYCENSEKIANIKTGKTLISTDQKFLAVHPFTGNEIGRDLDEERILLIEEQLKTGFRMLINGEDIFKLININH